jgi:reactive intermediate/imine deaminase
VGPYSQAIRAGDTLYLSGQIPLDPTTGQLVEGDIAVHARRVLDNLRAILGAAGLSMSDVVRSTIFLTNLDDFPAVNDVYRDAFGEPYPARSTVEVSRLPAGARIEIDAIAVAGG